MGDVLPRALCGVGGNVLVKGFGWEGTLRGGVLGLQGTQTQAVMASPFRSLAGCAHAPLSGGLCDSECARPREATCSEAGPAPTSGPRHPTPSAGTWAPGPLRPGHRRSCPGLAPADPRPPAGGPSPQLLAPRRLAAETGRGLQCLAAATGALSQAPPRRAPGRQHPYSPRPQPGEAITQPGEHRPLVAKGTRPLA